MPLDQSLCRMAARLAVGRGAGASGGKIDGIMINDYCPLSESIIIIIINSKRKNWGANGSVK
jgi:hypothetical protein